MPEEHIKYLRGVFKKLSEAGLKLKPSKCEFFKEKIAYLRHIISNEGIETDPKKIVAVKLWPQTQNCHSGEEILRVHQLL